MKKYLVAVGLFVFIIALPGFLPAASPKEIHIRLGTSKVGGSYYMFGGGVSSRINSLKLGIVITAQTTKGSRENTRILGKRVDMAFMNGAALWESRVKENLIDSRAIFTTGESPSHWVTLEESGIKKVEDLVGKKISIGAPGSGTERTTTLILQAYNLWDKVKNKVVRLGFS